MSILKRLFGSGKEPHRTAASTATPANTPSPAVHDDNDKTVGSVFAVFMLKHEQEIKELDAMVALEVIDTLRGIINSNFAKDKIQQGLQHRNYRVRNLVEQFLNDLKR